MKIIVTRPAWIILVIGASLVIGIMTPRYFGNREDITATPPPDRSPFHSVVVRDGAIVATLPTTPAWMVDVGASESRRSKPEESFTIHAGSVIELYERHSSYKVTAQIIPTAGLTIESTFDARSFGKGVTTRKFFVAAK